MRDAGLRGLLLFTLGLAACASGSDATGARAASRADAAPPPTATGALLALGKDLYARHCAGCHGSEGRGDGIAAPHLYPKPRDFGLGAFKLTSTPTGSLPTDDDLFRTLTNGMPGSAMPSWARLPDSDRRALVAHVKTLARYFDEDEGKWVQYYDLGRPMTPVPVPPPPPRTAETIARGKLVYRKAECWKCHGDEGRGDGPSAPTLKDSWGYPIRARDYTAGIFKGGDDPAELFRRVTIGLNGTPMPSHETALTAPERWDVVHYVLSMARPGAQEMARQAFRTLRARRVPPGADWDDPASARWTGIEPVYVALMPLWWRDRRIEGVLVRSAHDGRALFLHLSWEDHSRDDEAVRPQDFRDAVAVQFARTPNAPFLAMGSVGEDVNVWMWKSDRDGGPASRPDVERTFPNLAVMDYPESSAWKPGEAGAAQRTLRELGPAFAPAWGAGNPVADPEASTPVENLAAHGFSTLAPLRGVSTRCRGRGAFDRGVWSVVLSRDLDAKDAGEASLVAGRRTPVAFAVWDGSAGDRNGQKSITIWHDLELEP